MFIYIVTYVLCFAFSVCLSLRFIGVNKRKIDSTNVYLCLCCVLFTCVMGFRAISVGTDTAMYSRIFTRLANEEFLSFITDSITLKAPGYAAICKLASFISSSVVFHTFTTAAFVNIGLFIFIKKSSLDVALSTFLWIGLTFFYMSMNINRQCMALVVMLNALTFLSQNIKSFKGWILFLCGVLIHATSFFCIIFIFGFFLSNKLKSTRKIFFASIVISVLSAFSFFAVMGVILSFFPRYYNMYFGESATISIFASDAQGRIVILYAFLLFVIILAVKKDVIALDNQSSDFDKKCFAIQIMPTVVLGSVWGIFYPDNTLISRILFYPIAGNICFIPFVLSRYASGKRKLLRAMVVVVLTVYSTVYLFEKKGGVLDYCFWWTN